VLCKLLRKRSDNAKSFVAHHWEEREQRVTHEKDLQGVVTKFPIDLDIRDVEHSLERAALEFQTQRMTNNALRTVAPDGIYRFDHLLAISAVYGCYDGAVGF